MAKKKGIIKFLGLVLSRHTEELKRMYSPGVCSPQKQSSYAYNLNRTNDNCDKSSVKLEGGEYSVFLFLMLYIERSELLLY